MLPHGINAKPNIICINLIQPHGWNSFLTNFVLFIYFLPGMGWWWKSSRAKCSIHKTAGCIDAVVLTSLCWFRLFWIKQSHNHMSGVLGHLNCGTDLGNRWILTKPLSRWPTNSRHVIVLSKIIWISVLLQLE